jgi:hypothetical protein
MRTPLSPIAHLAAQTGRRAAALLVAVALFGSAMLGMRELQHVKPVAGPHRQPVELALDRYEGYLRLSRAGVALGVVGLALAVAGATVTARDRRRARGEAVPRRAVRAGGLALVAATAASAVAFGLAARDTTLTDLRESEQLGDVVPGTLRALGRPDVVGGGRDGRYLVDFTIDPIAIGSQGFGLVNELERAGYDVGLPELHWAGGTRHRVLDPEDSTGVVHLAVGDAIADLEGRAGVEEVARSDPRSPAERAEFDRLSAELEGELRAAGLDDLARDVDRLLFAVTLDPRLPAVAHGTALRLMELGLPIAVFLGPPESAA